MKFMAINLLITLILLVGFACLQFFLSLRKNRWYGLIIPMFSFIFGILSGPVQLLAGSGIVLIMITTLLSLIPFSINLIIYFACRSKLKERTGRANELDRMKIKDM